MTGYKPRAPDTPGKTGFDGKPLQDFTAFDNGESFGRIQLELTAHTKVGKWKWNMTHIKWAKRHSTPWQLGRYGA